MKAFLNKISSLNIVFISASIVMAIVLFFSVTSAFLKADADINSSIIIGDFKINAYFLEGSDRVQVLNIPSDKLIPGESITKTLVLEIPSNYEPAYVRIRGEFQIKTEGEFNTNYAVQMRPKLTASNWRKGLDNAPLYWYYYNSYIESSNEVEVDIEFIVLPYEDNTDYAIGNDVAGKDYKVLVYVDAVQHSNNGHEIWGADRPANWPSQ